MYNNGLLCNCNRYDKVIIEDPVHGDVYKEEIQHKKNCEGRIKLQEMIGIVKDKNGEV